MKISDLPDKGWNTQSDVKNNNFETKKAHF